MVPRDAVPPDGVREVDHSGDVGLEIWGGSREEVLVNATRGLCGLMAWSQVDTVCTRRIEVHAGSFADLLVEWLCAVVLAAATHAELYESAHIDAVDDGFASGIIFGEPLDPGRHNLRFDVKAATYHDVLMEHSDAGYHARVIFDL